MGSTVDKAVPDAALAPGRQRSVFILRALHVRRRRRYAVVLGFEQPRSVRQWHDHIFVVADGDQRDYRRSRFRRGQSP